MIQLMVPLLESCANFQKDSLFMWPFLLKSICTVLKQGSDTKGLISFTDWLHIVEGYILPWPLSVPIFYFLSLFLETGFHFVAQVGSDLIILNLPSAGITGMNYWACLHSCFLLPPVHMRLATLLHHVSAMFPAIMLCPTMHRTRSSRAKWSSTDLWNHEPK
jgi:hypothetical protein